MNFELDDFTAEETILSDVCEPAAGLNADDTILSVGRDPNEGLKAEDMISSVVWETSVLKTSLGLTALARVMPSAGLNGAGAAGLATAGSSFLSSVPATVPAAAAAANAAWFTESSFGRLIGVCWVDAGLKADFAAFSASSSIALISFLPAAGL